jgi:dipeptide transport system ATP-binding protein
MSATSAPSPAIQPVVLARNLTQVYKISRGMFHAPDHLQAVSGVSFSVNPGKTLAVVGESGCGKSTLARMVSLIETPSSGELRLGQVDVVKASGKQRQALRRTVQLVFQNPFGSLNPRKKNRCHSGVATRNQHRSERAGARQKSPRHAGLSRFAPRAL